MKKSFLLYLSIFFFILFSTFGCKDKNSINNKKLPKGWRIWRELGPLYTLEKYNKSILVGGTKGVWQLDYNSSKPKYLSGIPKGAVVRTIICLEDGSCLAGHTKGISVLKKSHWYNLVCGKDTPTQMIEDIIALSNNHLIAGGVKSLVDIKIKNQKYQCKEIVIPKQPWWHITSLLKDSYGVIWIGTNQRDKGGVILFKDNHILKRWDSSNGLPHSQITSIMEDTDARVWVGTGFLMHGGVGVFSHKNKIAWERNFTLKSPPLVGSKVRSLYQDSKGRYWIGSEKRGLTILDRYTHLLKIIDKDRGLPANEVTAIIEDENGSIWLATLKGLVKIINF